MMHSYIHACLLDFWWNYYQREIKIEMKQNAQMVRREREREREKSSLHSFGRMGACCRDASYA